MTEYSEALENFNKAFDEIIKSLVEGLKPVIEAVTKTVFEQIRPVMNVIVEGFRYYCKHYDNKRVVHLALHAKKARVRNKNRNRLFNDYLKALQRGVVQ
ncbi:hypothetical protein [Ruminococcus sp. YE282]|uniref:hypothetical protein n=1 Tax=Ruminococcus sp. YE282 TaxID=3158780 RepID=UPI00088619FA|nr:hypothetical protein SAMN02910441_01499 [Ruminococcus bromii]